MFATVFFFFFPTVDKDPHSLCTNCLRKECNIEDRCSNCHDWSDEMWNKVSTCRIKLAVQREKKERKAKCLVKLEIFLLIFCVSVVFFCCHLQLLRKLIINTQTIIIVFIMAL